MRRVVLCVASAALLVAGCSGDDDIDPVDAVETDDDVDQPEQDEPEPEPEEADDDPFAVPDEIDEDYLQRVADEIMAIRTDILRDTVEANPETDRLSEDIRLRLDSIFSGPALVAAIDNFQEIVRAENADEVFLEPTDMDQNELIVEDVLNPDAGCTTIVARFDYSGTERSPADPNVFRVVALQRTDDGNAQNPSGWKLFDSRQVVNTQTDAPATAEEIEQFGFDVARELIDATCGGA